jgi:Zn-dependent membrane protease YugP
MFEGYTLFLLLSLPALALGIWAQFKVRSAFNKNAEIRTSTGMTGAQVARRVLDINGLNDVQVEQVNGFLSDHYDPRHRVLRLSPDVYAGNSLSAAGVAAHEAGHALQHKDGYAMLKVRSAMVPAVQIGSWLGPLIFLAGFFMAGMIGTSLAWLGFLLFAAVALFALVTLPVEFDASNRAKRLLISQNIIFPQEMGGVNAVLSAAALTYVAAAIQAISTLLYYGMMLVGINRD